jgi:hypothetical protein
MARCRVCTQSFEPTARQIQKSDWLCKPCCHEYDRKYRTKRKSEGRPVKTGKMPREWHRAYQAGWKERPGIRARLAETARERRKHPLEQTKASARRIVRSAIERGELERQPCEMCGHVKVDAHHDDYSWPLEVRWLCRQHHTDIHCAKAKGEKNG